jgi:hypothetical protein
MTRREEGERLVGMLGRAMAEELADETTGPPMGFLVLLFDFPDDPRHENFTAYASNARREDAIKILREHLSRLEAGCN